MIKTFPTTYNTPFYVEPFSRYWIYTKTEEKCRFLLIFLRGGGAPGGSKNHFLWKNRNTPAPGIWGGTLRDAMSPPKMIQGGGREPHPPSHCAAPGCKHSVKMLIICIWYPIKVTKYFSSGYTAAYAATSQCSPTPLGSPTCWPYMRRYDRLSFQQIWLL